MEKLLRYETCNLWIDCMLMEHGNMFGMKNVICVIMFNQGKTWKKDEIYVICGVTVWLRRIWLTVVLQAIRVLRNGEYAPYIVFIAAPTIATLQEVHRVSATLYQCCLCLYIHWPPGLSIPLIAILVLFWG